MESRPNYLIVGIFVLLLSAGAVFFALWMGKFNEKKREYKYYYTYMMESVSGLPKDGAVKYMGVEIGRVKHIDVDSKDPTHIRLTLKIPADFIVRKGMYTQLKLEGITGIAYVEIAGGKIGAKPIETEKGRIPVIPSRPSALTKLGDALPEVAINMADAFGRFNKTFNDEFIEHLQQTAAHLDASSRHLEAILNEKNAKHLETIFTNLAKASGKLDNLYEASDAVKSAALELKTDGNQTMRSIRESADAFKQMNDTFTRHLEAGQFDLQSILRPTLARTDTLLESTQALVYELQEEVEALRQSPRDLLFKESKPLLGPGESAETASTRQNR